MHLYNLLRMAPETKLYESYSKRIQHYRSNPPGPDWDGVFTFETK
jgi:adenylate cyclase